MFRNPYLFICFSTCLGQAHTGAFASTLKGSVLSTLLDAGLLFLLRFSLDDSVEGVIAAATQALRALLVSAYDEVIVSHTPLLHHSSPVNSLCGQDGLRIGYSAALHILFKSFMLLLSVRRHPFSLSIQISLSQYKYIKYLLSNVVQKKNILFLKWHPLKK